MAYALLTGGCSPAAIDPTPNFPRKPIKVIVPFGAGGGSDTFVRILQQGIQEEQLLEQPLVVINVPGAGGAVGSRKVKDALADGHTILCLHEGIFCSKYAGRTVYGPEAFRAIAATGKAGLVICVQQDSPFQDLNSLMSAAKERPNEIRFGMAPGTPTHFVSRRLEATAQDDSASFRNVASGGGAKRFHDLTGGHIEVAPFSVAEYRSFKTADLRAIAVLEEERLSEFPQIPTAREQGFDVVMQNIQYWWAPRDTPDSTVQRIAEMLDAAMKAPSVRSKLEELSIQPIVLMKNELQEHLTSREQKFQEVALVKMEGLPDPVFPIVALALICGSLSLRDSRHRPKSSLSPEFSTRKFATFSFVALGCYVLGMQLLALPYFLATGVFIPLLGYLAGGRSRRAFVTLVAAGVGISLGCNLIFTKLLLLDLP